MSANRGVQDISSLDIAQSNVKKDYGLSEMAYSYGYELRLKYSSFMQDTLNWVTENISDLLSQDASNILSLGCGSGVFDLMMLKAVRSHSEDWTLKGIDYSARDIDLFRERLLLQPEDVRKRVRLEHREFSSSVTLGDEYDLITMIHFLHSFDEILPIINNALRHLSANGKLLIVQQNSKGVAKLRKRFSSFLPNQKFYSSEQVKALFQSQEIPFKSHLINSFFDVSSLGKMSLDTLVLMSFCLSNDLSVLNSQKQEEIRNAFLCRAGKQPDGSLIIDEQMEVIICQR